MTTNKLPNPKPQCLRPDCTREARSRGLCKTDNASAAKLVREGLTTWATLEANGKAKPLRHGAVKIWFLDIPARSRAINE